ncbi:MAG: hypothetical protein ABFD79_02540 [Phycisphaerales bacterium]
MAKFKKTLEEKANEIVAYPARAQWENSIPGMIRREIALTVDQIRRLQERHDEQFMRLLRVECYVDTELLNMEQRQPRYAPYHFPEKDKLKQRLFDIEKERRNLSLRLEEKTQSLEDRLLSLINKHQQLDENGR